MLWATDEFFAPKENLLKASAPVFLPDKYTENGKWMDGWETRRHRAPDHDWCLIRLGAPGIIRGVVVDTAHFTGNFPEQCSLEGSADQENWTEILPPSELRGGSENRFAIGDPLPIHASSFSHLSRWRRGALARAWGSGAGTT